MLENGDLIFVRDESDMGQAIQTSTGNYNHVAICLDGMIYHASGKAGRVLSVRNQQTSLSPITCTTSMFTQKWISSL